MLTRIPLGMYTSVAQLKYMVILFSNFLGTSKLTGIVTINLYPHQQYIWIPFPKHHKYLFDMFTVKHTELCSPIQKFQFLL